MCPWKAQMREEAGRNMQQIRKRYVHKEDVSKVSKVLCSDSKQESEYVSEMREMKGRMKKN